MQKVIVSITTYIGMQYQTVLIDKLNNIRTHQTSINKIYGTIGIETELLVYKRSSKWKRNIKHSRDSKCIFTSLTINKWIW